ncbi:MAG: 16S rRNA (cytosine(967)-C(5))-methyltransferase RsmB [Ignavibacteriales bacterium]|nr:16S rRNA (cytosine(967)-C(5))-methyltransferase RsmB [Ignavibacteriales bacterium]
MKFSSLLGHTREVLQLVQESGRPADNLIDTFFRTHKYLGSHDRRFIAETAYGTLRHLRRCEKILVQVLGARADGMLPEDAFLLLAVTYLAAIDRRTPLNVADVTEAVKSGRLRPHLHAILQEIPQANLPEPVDPMERIGQQYSFPDWIVRRLLDQYGEPETEQICKSLNGQAPLTLRVNTLKTTVEECQRSLAEEDIQTQPTRLSPFGLTVSKRMNVFQFQAFRDGFFEVQDEGSQLLPFLIDPKPTAKVLDACAGAGGKTLELAALMKNRGEIVASDVHSTRLEELQRRLRRAGASNVRVRRVDDIADLTDRYSDYFDVVLLDAPCSGIGTLRRNPGMKWVVTEETVHEVAEKQMHILESSVQLVKPKGMIAYATCTLFREENEDIVERFLSAHPDFALERPPLSESRFDLTPFASGKYTKLYPHRDGTDGFFIAVMRRNGI